MSHSEPAEHVYERLEHGGAQDSLQLVLAQIDPDWTVLDLGMGTGGLARARAALGHRGPTDGVTLSMREAELGEVVCRRVVVADLDSAELAYLFDGTQYDAIVCADVLEHLKSPERLLMQCKQVLCTGGRLIASIPNVGHCGLIAELLQGEWRYRPEGLLDATHLRFFTRRSLQRFFADNGWGLRALQTTTRLLGSTEFQGAIDALPPSVARHLLALPDALTYQFIVVLQPEASPAQPWPTPVQERLHSQADFAAALYPAVLGAFDEASKIVARGSIGQQEQWLSFALPPSAQSYSGLRFDPADRPGYLHLRALELLLPDGIVAWSWRAVELGADVLLRAGVHELLALPAESPGEVRLLLLGDDPWIELPIPRAALRAAAWRGATLRAQLGWPMSADYALAAQVLTDLREQAAQQAMLLQQALHKQERDAQMQQALQTQLESQVADLRGQLQRIEHSTVFRFTRPLVRAKEAFERWFGRTRGSGSDIVLLAAPASAIMGEAVASVDADPVPTIPTGPRMIDIVVPVYADLAGTRRCVESVLAAPCKANWRLLLVDDCGPDPALGVWLEDLAQREPRVTLLRNEQNLGFVASVNRGMALHTDADVLLLNSDTEVANDWLDRLQRAAYRAPDIASVTPCSNNATICSYPRFCADNDLPEGWSVQALDAECARLLQGQSVDVPTGVGFCMYLRRDALAQVGLFDVERFGRGYGEENDFCMRARNLGWRHVHVLDTYVWHQGGASFGPEKAAREARAMDTLRQLHPGYEALVHDYLQRDPARLARRCLDLARTRRVGAWVVLVVLHDRQGGTLRHVGELEQRLGYQATFLRLLPTQCGARLRVPAGEQGDVAAPLEHDFRLPDEGPALLETLRQLQVGQVHIHHVLGHHPWVDGLAQALGVPLMVTVHDYYAVCPQISLTGADGRYCGEHGVAQCRACLQDRPAPDGLGIERWRARHAAVLNAARVVLTPSLDAAVRMAAYVPTARVAVVPHEREVWPGPRPLGVAGRALRVVVIGALSDIKGADVVEAVAREAQRRGAAIEIHLLGYAYRALDVAPQTTLMVHGSYADADLPQLLEQLAPDLAWFPALWPETYSYTLSAALQARLPVLASSLGAFAERLQGRPFSWVVPWDCTPSQWLEIMLAIQGGDDLPASSEWGTSPDSLNDGRVNFDYVKDYLANEGPDGGRMG